MRTLRAAETSRFTGKRTGSIMNRVMYLLLITMITSSGCQPGGKSAARHSDIEADDKSAARRSDDGADDDATNIEKWVVAEVDPISIVGHGVALNSEGKEIEATPEFVIGVQRYYMKSLYLQAGEKQRDEFQARLRRLYNTRLAQQEQMVVNSALIAWMIAEVRPRNASKLAINNSWIAGVARQRMSNGGSAGEPLELKELLGRLKREGLEQ